MNTVKRLILLEATFQKFPSYKGNIDKLPSVQQHIHLVNQLRKA